MHDDTLFEEVERGRVGETDNQMNSAEFIKHVNGSRDKLVSLVEKYHPRSGGFAYTEEHVATAPMVQTATNIVCGRIIKRGGDSSPAQKLRDSLDSNDALGVYNILQETWFGVPETTAWRSIEGAKECCGLLEEYPTDLNCCEKCGEGFKGDKCPDCE